MMIRRPLRRAQQGVILLVGMMMLIMLTLMAVAAFNLGKANFVVVANTQQRLESSRTAEMAVEVVLSDPTISNTGAFTARTINVDLDLDGTNDYTTTVTRSGCLVAVPIKVKSLDLNVANDVACTIGQTQNFGVTGAVDEDSLCADTVRELIAVTTSTNTLMPSSSTVVQGFGVRQIAAELGTSCN